MSMVQYRVILLLLASVTIIYFTGAAWAILTPSTQYSKLGRQVNVSATGTGEAEGYAFVLKVEVGEFVVQQGSDEVNTAEQWAKDLEPPQALPYNSLWPEGNATLGLYYQDAIQTNVGVEFVPEG